MIDLSKYFKQVATARGLVWVDHNNNVQPDIPSTWAKTKFRHADGSLIWKDMITNREVNHEAAPTETRPQKQARELAEAQAEVDSQNPVLQSAKRVARLEAQVLSVENQIKVDNIKKGEQSAELRALCTTTTKEEWATAEEMQKDVEAAGVESVRRLKKRGIDFEEIKSDLGKVLFEQTHNTDIDLSNADNFETIFDWLIQIGYFHFEPAPVVAPAPPRDILKEMEATTDAKELRRLTHEAMVNEAKPLVLQFFQFVEENYNINLTEALKQRVISYCVAQGAFNANTLNAARRDVLSCRTADEQLQLAIENTDSPLTGNYAARVDFKNRQRAITEQTI